MKAHKCLCYMKTLEETLIEVSFNNKGAMML